MPIVTLGITEFQEILGRVYGIETQDSGFYSKIGSRFGIESIRGRWYANSNPRDYGIPRNFGSGLRDLRTLPH